MEELMKREEFAEGFNDFRDWLYDQRDNISEEKSGELEEIISMFEELGIK